MAGRLRLPAALAGALIIGMPAAAQQPPAADHRLVLPVPSPSAVDPQAAPPPGAPTVGGRLPAEAGDLRLDCRRDLPCRLRLRGVLGGNNGGIAVEGTAFTW